MTISLNWLRNILQTSYSNEILLKKLTEIGLEVESFESWNRVKGGLEGVVVAEILQKEKHPDADKLSITKVSTGTQEYQVVCGASNVEAGQKVLLALIGTVLPYMGEPPIVIRKAKIRGVESEGMICAEDELGLGNSHDGIIVLPENSVPGMPAADFYKLHPDHLIEIGLTPNRADAFSHYGVARDLFAGLEIHSPGNATLIKPEITQLFSSNQHNSFSVILSSENCSRYCGALLKVNNNQAVPLWLSDSLSAIGVKSINPVVDITNYVLHELGQPLHAFDFSKIKNTSINVRQAKDSEKMTGLANEEISLTTDDLVITDSEKILAVAGVYGSNNSGCDEQTEYILLESACFDPSSVRRSSMRLKLRSDAAQHFEKGTDPDACLHALSRAVFLLQTHFEAEVIDHALDVYPKPYQKRQVKVSYKRIKNLIGFEIPNQIIKDIITLLEMNLVQESESDFTVEVPGFKPDVYREADIIEEILRIYGLDPIPVPELFKFIPIESNEVSMIAADNKVAGFLNARGYFEMMTNTVDQSKRYETPLEHPESKLIQLLNSQTAELDIMKANMLYAALEVVAYNLNRQAEKLRFFEIGNIYQKKSDGYKQIPKLMMISSGPDHEAHWKSKPTDEDFFSFKAEVIHLTHYCGLELEEVAAPEKHPDYLYELHLLHAEETHGKICEVHPSLLQKYGIKNKVFYADLNWELLKSSYQSQKSSYKPVSKFPMVSRDLAIIIPESVSYAHLKSIAENTISKTLHKITLFDIYRDENIGNGKKSYAIRLELESKDKTLTDSEVDNLIHKLVKAFEKNAQAYLRQ